jgi:hypothetical protein
MKQTLATVLFFGCAITLALADDVSQNYKSGAYSTFVTIGPGTQHGFLQFRAKLKGREIVALCSDIGSSSPWTDLRVYLSSGSIFVPVLTLPCGKQHGFICRQAGSTMEIYMTTPSQPKPSGTPYMTVDLNALVSAYD